MSWRITRPVDVTSGPRATKCAASRSRLRKPPDLVAFLETLTDYKFLTNPALSNPLSNPDMREELKKGARTKSDPPGGSRGALVISFPAHVLVAIIGAGDRRSRRRALAARARVDFVRLIDETDAIAAGKALDLMQAGPISRSDTRIEGVRDLAAADGAAAIVLADAAGARTEGGQRASRCSAGWREAALSIALFSFARVQDNAC